MRAARLLSGLWIALSASFIPATDPIASARLIHVPGHQATIQAAIDDANHGDTILIAPGTWNGPGNRNLDTLGKAIVIRSLMGPATCVIDCQNQGRGFYFHGCESAATVVRGLTIRGGSADHGGGIAGYWSAPRIVDCIITGCSATGAGGGIDGCYFSPEIVDCRIEGNRALDGGGVSLDYSPAARLIRCTIRANNAERAGGGICNSDGSTPLLFDCTISGNSSLLGGGVYCRDSEAVVQECRIEENIAWDGGGFFSCGPRGPHLLDTLLSRNKASYGGAVYGHNCELQVTNCLLVENSATITGGALFGQQVTGTIDSCTFSENAALGSLGGGVTSRDSSLVIIDSILWDDRPDEIFTATGDSPLVTYSTVAGGYPGQGNLDNDPLFTNALCGSHCLCQLAAGELVQSPCIDAGSRVFRFPSSPASGGAPQSLGTITRSDWGADTGRLDLGYHHRLKTIHARIDCLPSFGWLPSRGTFTLTLGNTAPSSRRIAGRLKVTTPDGTCFPSWRTGWADVGPDKRASWSWNLTFPAHPALTGASTFSLNAEDVTPPPFNQPPCPPAGHRAEDACTVTGALPPY